LRRRRGRRRKEHTLNFFCGPDLNSSLVLWACCRSVHGKPAKPVAMWVMENRRRNCDSLWSWTCDHDHSFCSSGHSGEQSAICYHSGTGNYLQSASFTYKLLEPRLSKYHASNIPSTFVA
jgi:hypothetical protein